ncbi:DUF6069 family protein [Actinoplanes sp. RD1]|uniref:DUF6069 family protein n=1 Tax=Actinoplanes sp. RD1 TaxID=3064538 RepID=UPI002741759E|nr:DUF6069 family protein [Actinoplanes sp. RD1]
MTATIPTSKTQDDAVRNRSWPRTAAAAGLGAAGAIIINSVIAWTARGLFDVPSAFEPLSAQAYLPASVIGALAGAIGWHMIAGRVRRGSRLPMALVPVVLALSLIPDVLLLADRSQQPGTTTAGVLMLMLMHLGVAAASVPAYRRLIQARP